MNIYKCVVSHRNGGPNDCIYGKVFYIKADCALTAYVKAKEVTKHINNVVYDPDIELYIPPEPAYTCTIDQVKRDYGLLAWNIAEEDTRFLSWRKKDGLDWRLP